MVYVTRVENSDVIVLQAVVRNGTEVTGDVFREVHPGEETFGVPYDVWLRHVGTRVDLNSVRTEGARYRDASRVQRWRY